MSIPLPPLPEPSGKVRLLGGATESVYTAEALRARDQEIVRCVLQAAAKAVRDSGVCPYAVADGIEALEFHHE